MRVAILAITADEQKLTVTGVLGPLRGLYDIFEQLFLGGYSET